MAQNKTAKNLSSRLLTTREKTSVKAKLGLESVKKNKHTLRESEKLFTAMFEIAPIGMGLDDKEGVVLQVNRAACEMIGYTGTELIGRRFTEFTHPDDVEICVRNINKLFDGEIDQFRLEKRYRHKQGHYIWVDTNVSLIHDKDSNPSYLIEQAQDITRRKVLEEDSLRANNEKEERVKDRTES